MGIYCIDLQKISIFVTGMTCNACSSKIEKALEALPEIEDAEVHYGKNNALIGIKKGITIPSEKILKAISSAGEFKGELKNYNKWVLKIDGMTCEGCAETLAGSLKKIPGVTNTSVDYGKSKAVLFSGLSVEKKQIEKVILDNGYILKNATKTKQAR